jgi:RNA polymerase sigma-70 factor (ECF subfamily)
VDSRATFPSTLWSVVLGAGEGREEALETLAARYVGPVYAFIRRAGRSREDAEDIAQDFFAFLLEANAIGKADPRRGRFRGFLAAALRNFLANDADRRRALKRGGDRRRLSLDVPGLEEALAAGPAEDPAACFDRDWATRLLARALDRLAGELEPRAAEAFALASAPDAPGYREIGARLDMTESAVATLVHRGRRRLRELLFDEARATVASDAEAEEELADLLAAFGPRKAQ